MKGALHLSPFVRSSLLLSPAALHELFVDFHETPVGLPHVPEKPHEFAEYDYCAPITPRFSTQKCYTIHVLEYAKVG